MARSRSAPRNKLRSIPSVDQVLRQAAHDGLPRPVMVSLVRKELAAHRAELRRKVGAPQPVEEKIQIAVNRLLHSRIQPLINGTGVIVHTNLGRSPMGPSVVAAVSGIASNFSNLEFDLIDGTRGGRAEYVEHNAAVLCGAEAATVVNNCAAALVLVLRHLASGEKKREVIISRGELVQIGGGFRIPEILEASGAILREAGTTNKTTAADYSRAVGERTAMILKVHRSNFFMAGFVESPDTSEIAAIAKRARVPFVEDLGSGAVFPTESIAPGAEHEPTPGEILRCGVDLVTFSGDKLLGGPQAGLIAGRAKLVSGIKRNPLFRAFRCDKLTLVALQETIDLHLRGDADAGTPIMSMIRQSTETLRERGARIIERLAGRPVNAGLTDCESQVGGGTLPQTRIASIAVSISSTNHTAQQLAARLRQGEPPVVATVSGNRVRIDLRTVFASQDEQLISAICGAL